MTLSTPVNLRTLPSPLFIIGAAHTGKSELALGSLSHELPTAVIGTGDHREEALSERISELKAMRPSHWQHWEQIENLPKLIRELQNQTPQILFDSINQWISGQLVHNASRYAVEQLTAIINAETDEICQLLQTQAKSRIVLVSSEVGAGIAPPRALPRLFRQLTSRIHCRLAASCASVVLVAAGLPLLIKGSSEATTNLRF